MNTGTIDLDEPTAKDFSWLKDQIKIFVRETGSVLGKNILDHWQSEHMKFIKVLKFVKSLFSLEEIISLFDWKCHLFFDIYYLLFLLYLLLLFNSYILI